MPSTIKQYAKEAKARMKSGFWSDVKAQRDCDVVAARNNGKSCDVVLNEYREILKGQLYNTKSADDEELYKKVSELLSRDEVLINPIGALADKAKMAAMSNSSKQQYILQLSEKFKVMKERYKHEKEMNCHTVV